VLSTAFVFDGWAQFTNVVINGYNKDLVVNGTGTASASVTSAFDASSFAFVAQDYPGVGTCFYQVMDYCLVQLLLV